MPEISRFLGIVMVMHFKEHNPPQPELLENWNTLRSSGQFRRIEPLA